MNARAGDRSVRVFYRDYVNGVSILSSQAEPLALARLAPLARRLLVTEDNFLGIVDRNDAILQCYLSERPDEVVFELLYPEATGCLRDRLPAEAAFERLAGLPEVFDDSLLRGACYVA